MFAVILTKEAKKNLKKITRRYQLKIEKCLTILEENPFYGKDVKKLSGELDGLYRYRIDTIRIIYHVNKADKIVYIISIASRGSAYK